MGALGAVFSLAARLQIRSRRTLVMALVAMLPVAGSMLATAVIRLQFGDATSTGFGQVAEVMSLIYLQFLLLAVTLFYATAIIGDEIDEKTITYLFVRPVPRAVIFLGKYLSCVLVGGLLIIPSAVLSFLILTSADPAEEAFRHLGVIAQDAAILILGILAYSSFFGLMGAALKRPLLWGILFCLGWESLVTYIPGFIHRFTIMHYLQSLLPHPSGQRGILSLFKSVTPASTSVITLLLIAAGLLALSCWTVSRKEYVLEA
jgi:ABC-type transport system involved in multi-copper enzyme maturation permease subunit